MKRLPPVFWMDFRKLEKVMYIREYYTWYGHAWLWIIKKMEGGREFVWYQVQSSF